MEGSENTDLYQKGAEFALVVQQALAEGKTFEDMSAFPPELAVQVRAGWQAIGSTDVVEVLDGYLSRWD